MALSQISEPSCKLQTLQKDLRLAINMSDSVDQPLHVGAAVNEVPVSCSDSFLYLSNEFKLNYKH